MNKKLRNQYYLTYKDLYSSNRYNKCKDIILNALDRKCVNCQSDKQIQVKYIKHPYKDPRGTFDIFNMQILCNVCKDITKDCRNNDDVTSIMDYCLRNRIDPNQIKSHLFISKTVFEPIRKPGWIKLYPDKSNKYSLNIHNRKYRKKSKPISSDKIRGTNKTYVRSDVYASRKRQDAKDRLYWQSVEKRFPVDVNSILEAQNKDK